MRFIILTTAIINMWGFVYSSPQIKITKAGKESVVLGRSIIYKITVKNNSSTPIDNIVINDKIPAGFKYRYRDTGKFSLQWNIKTLQGNEQRTFRYTLQATQEGKFTSTTHLYIAGKKSNQIHFNTIVAKPKITIEISCPGIAFLGKRIRVTLSIKNTGSINLNDVILQSSQSFASSLQIIAAEGNPKINGPFAIWDATTLAVGETKSYSLTLQSKNCGDQCISANVYSAEGANSQAECCTNWRGCWGLLLEVIDTSDPITVNEETTYVIQVVNQGNKTEYYARIEAVFPEEISPISAQGDTQCTISGKRVTVDSFPALRPKEKIQWKIRAKAVKPGDSRLKVYLSSAVLRKPVAEEESTHVYQGNPHE